MLVPEYMDQIALRMAHEGCRTCLENGECFHCGCKSPDLFYEKDMECSGGNWSGMIDKSLWPKIKKDTGVKPNPEYLEQIKKHGKIINF